MKSYQEIESEWKHLGRSPIEDIRVPRVQLRWRVEKEGYEVSEGIGRWRLKNLTLSKRGTIPAEMVRRLGCNVPHHVQMFFTHVWDACKRANRMTVTSEDAAKVYGNEMLGVRGHAELTHYEERLKMVLGSETLPLALDMVTEAAVTGCLGRAAIADLRNEYAFEGRKTAEVQEEILRVLEHDGYLEGADDGYVFVSRLLRDWWRKRYGNLFIPVAQRKA